MADQPKSDRSTVTISKKAHRRLRMAAAALGVTQKSFVETAIAEFMKSRAGLNHILKEVE